MYCTLDRAKTEIKTSSTANATEDAYIFRAVQAVTRRVQTLAGGANIDFEPYYEIRYFDAVPENIDSRRRMFHLHDYLLEVDTLTVDTTNLVWNTDVTPYPRTRTPYKILRLTSNTHTWYPQCNSTDTLPEEKVVITGWWGYKERADVDGWLSSMDTVQNNPLTAGSATITVADADGADSKSRTPRFSPGNLLRIEDEMCAVYAVDTTSNILSVFRGVRGTTAVAHNAGTAIQIWEVEEDIQRVTARWAAMLYARRGAFEQVQLGDLATVTFPADATVEFLAAIQRYING